MHKYIIKRPQQSNNNQLRNMQTTVAFSSAQQIKVSWKVEDEFLSSRKFCGSGTLTSFGAGGGDGALDVPKDGVDGDGVLSSQLKALDHVVVVRVP